MTLDPPARTSKTWAWTVLLVLLLALRLPAIVRPAGGDQNLYTYVAQRVIAGDVPYRDAWEQKPPAIFFVYAAFLQVSSSERLVGIADFAAAAIGALLLVGLGRRMFGGHVGEGAAAALLLLGDPGIQKLGGMNFRAQCETFIGLAVTGALLLAWRRSPRPWHLVATGVCLALACWLKYNAILFALPIALAVAWPVDVAFNWRRFLVSAAWITAGALGLSAVFLGYFIASGAFTDLWLATIGYNLRYSGETYAGAMDAVNYVVTLPYDHAKIDGLWFVGLLGAVLAVVLTRVSRASLIAFAWIAAAVFSIALNGRRGLPQYFLQASPALALAASAGLAAVWRARHEARFIAAGVAIVLLAGLWKVGVEITPTYQPRLFGLPQTVENIADDLRYLRGDTLREAYLARFDRGVGGKFSPLAVERLAARANSLAAPSDRIYVFGFSGGGVLVRAGRASASRFFWSRPVVIEFEAGRPGYGSAGLLVDLTRTQPAIVALQKHDWGLGEKETPDSIRFFMDHPALRSWLEAGYVPDYEDDVYAVWRRKS
jgi:hypothetical protein